MYHLKVALGVSIAVCSTFSLADPAELPSQSVQAKFEKALTLRESGDLYAAIDNLEEILNTQPSLHRARLELAVSYYRADEHDKAIELAQAVLDDPETAGEVVTVVSIFLSQVEELKEVQNTQRNRWIGSVSLGIGYDDNVNVGPSDEEFNIRGSIFTLNSDSAPKEDFFTSLSANIDHSYSIPGTFRIGNRPVKGSWNSSLGVSRRNYDDEKDRSLDIITASTGFALQSRSQWRTSLNLQLDQIRLDEESLVLFSSLNPSFTYNNLSGSEYTVRGGLAYRDYNQSADKERNGKRVSIGGDFVHRYSNSFLLQTGITFLDQDAKAENQKNKAVDGYISLLTPAWTNGQFFSRASYRVTKYDGQVAVFDESRKDREQRYTIGLLHNFAADLQMRGSITRTDTKSSIESFEFDRSEFSIDLTKRF
jgi:tetratricopeptide (TPR) repeat protein